MKKVIDGKLYSTEAAEELANWNNGMPFEGFIFTSEVLYKTAKGQYFLACKGGHGTFYRGREKVKLFNESEVKSWLEKTDNDQVYIDLFDPEEG
jgi:hypothetical protein